MSVIKTMIYAAESKANSWKKVLNDPVALAESGKTPDEVFGLIQYFEGKYDAYLDVVKVCKCDGEETK